MAHLSIQYLERLREAFESGQDSDVTILCGSERFSVHKFQLSQHSSVPHTMLHGRFKVHLSQSPQLKYD